jgi:hypothetical protein
MVSDITYNASYVINLANQTGGSGHAQGDIYRAVMDGRLIATVYPYARIDIHLLGHTAYPMYIFAVRCTAAALSITSYIAAFLVNHKVHSSPERDVVNIDIC